MTFRRAFSLLAASACALAALAAPPPAAAGTRVVLRDGRTLEGDAALADGRVTVGGESLDRAAVRRIVFDRTATAEASAAAPERRPLPEADRAEFAGFTAEAAAMAKRWPDAAYLVLLDRVDAECHADGTRAARSRYVLLARKESAKAFARLQAWYVEGRERVRWTRARCVKPDGTFLELDPASVNVTTPSVDASTFIKYQRMSGVIPGVEVGDLLDIETLNEETNPFRREFWFPQMYFQSSEPCRRAEASFTVPEPMRLHFTVRNFPPGGGEPAETSAGGRRTWRFALEDLPPYVEEPLDPPYADITPYVQASLFEGWKPVADWVGAMWRENSRPSGELAAFTRDLVKGCRTEDEKAARIYHWIQRNIRYVIVKGDMSTLWGSWPADTIRDQKFGCCVDKAQVLSAMLAAVGIESTPVAVNAGERRLDPKVATLQITHAITRAVIGGKVRILDSTGYDHRYPSYPAMDHGREILNPRLGGLEETPHPPPGENALRYEFDIELSPEGGARMRRRGDFTGDEEAMRRGYWKTVKEDEWARVFSGVANEIAPGARLLDFGLEHRDDLDGPFATLFAAAWDDYGKRAGDLLVVPLPGLERTFPEAGLAARRYPIRYGATSRHELVYRIVWPKGRMAPAFPPGRQNLKNPHAGWAVDVEPGDGAMTVTARFERTGVEVPVKDYPAWKGFLDEVARLSREPLLFRVKDAEGGEAR